MRNRIAAAVLVLGALLGAAAAAAPGTVYHATAPRTYYHADAQPHMVYHG